MGVENTGIVTSVTARSSAETALVYIGFWRRLAAHLVDLAIFLPYALLSSWFVYRSKEGFVISQIAGLIIAVLFEIYLVKRFGGTPGKLLLKMRIAKVDGS